LSCSNFIERVPERLTLVLGPWILIVLFTTGDFIGGQGDAWRSVNHFVGTRTATAAT
jgi:hypothetical protein